jgi:hypothetical protein
MPPDRLGGIFSSPQVIELQQKDHRTETDFSALIHYRPAHRFAGIGEGRSNSGE